MISVRSTYHELVGRGSVEFVTPHPLWYSYHTHKRGGEKWLSFKSFSLSLSCSDLGRTPRVMQAAPVTLSFGHCFSLGNIFF